MQYIKNGLSESESWHDTVLLRTGLDFVYLVQVQYDFIIIIIVYSRPGGSAGNLEIFCRWDVSLDLDAVTRCGIFFHKINK